MNSQSYHRKISLLNLLIKFQNYPKNILVNDHVSWHVQSFGEKRRVPPMFSAGVYDSFIHALLQMGLRSSETWRKYPKKRLQRLLLLLLLLLLLWWWWWNPCSWSVVIQFNPLKKKVENMLCLLWTCMNMWCSDVLALQKVGVGAWCTANGLGDTGSKAKDVKI